MGNVSELEDDRDRPAPVGRPRRHLTTTDRLVRMPLGLLWLGVVAIVAVPVLVWMTLLHGAVLAGRRLRRVLFREPGRREPAA